MKKSKVPLRKGDYPNWQERYEKVKTNIISEKYKNSN